jgi:hypothetical protein
MSNCVPQPIWVELLGFALTGFIIGVWCFLAIVDWGEPIDFRYENDVKHVFRLPVQK